MKNVLLKIVRELDGYGVLAERGVVTYFSTTIMEEGTEEYTVHGRNIGKEPLTVGKIASRLESCFDIKQIRAETEVFEIRLRLKVFEEQEKEGEKEESEESGEED